VSNSVFAVAKYLKPLKLVQCRNTVPACNRRRPDPAWPVFLHWFQVAGFHLWQSSDLPQCHNQVVGGAVHPVPNLHSDGVAVCKPTCGWQQFGARHGQGQAAAANCTAYRVRILVRPSLQ
jgi:hypothetical protein